MLKVAKQEIISFERKDERKSERFENSLFSSNLFVRDLSREDHRSVLERRHDQLVEHYGGEVISRQPETRGTAKRDQKHCEKC